MTNWRNSYLNFGMSDIWTENVDNLHFFYFPGGLKTVDVETINSDENSGQSPYNFSVKMFKA